MAKTAKPQPNWSVGRIKAFPVGRVREYPFDDERRSVVIVLKGQEEVMRHYLPDWAYDNPQYAAMRDIFIRGFGYSDAQCTSLSFDDIIDILKRDLEKHQECSAETVPKKGKGASSDFGKASGEEGASLGSDSAIWSKPLSKSQMMAALGIDSYKKFNQVANSWGMKSLSRQTHLLRLDLMDSRNRSKIEGI